MSESAQARKKARNTRYQTPRNMTIIDNEVSMNQIPQGQNADTEYGEEAPQVDNLFFVVAILRVQMFALPVYCLGFV